MHNTDQDLLCEAIKLHAKGSDQAGQQPSRPLRPCLIKNRNELKT